MTILIGRISDEFHLVKEPWLTLAANRFLIKADAPVYAVERLVGVDLSDYPADTVLDLLNYVLDNSINENSVWDQPEFLIKIYKVEKEVIKEVLLELKVNQAD
ncbi:hypothetical protein F7310_01735 [Francisella uliginis]|uniref:Uncharacterized protein n=1 Tax=Francisella uliginis TaxID=573570 RepID=A0A1L4BQM2_9GAMM|nr:transporter associated domain-containing protein [Francisella uliginis]API86150.1 hypothetical protein F7310_01735 [Francisella uliginis]